jgi:hypothetical protein
MKFDKGNFDINGTHFLGNVYTTYEELCEYFGDPTEEDTGMDKVNCQWILKFQDGTIATIYDWDLSSTPKRLYHWHVGGFNSKAVEYVYSIIKGR